MRPTSRQTTMVGPTQGGDGFGLGRGGGWYRRRLERDFGIRRVPFPGRRPARRGRAATINDRTPAGRLAATVALLACLCLAGCGGDGSGGAKAATAPEPLGSGPLVERNQSQFQRDLEGLRGRVVVVNFWASWCVPCREEMPSIERLRTSLEGRRFVVLAVNLAEPESRIRKFLEGVPVRFPVLLDRDTQSARAWQAKVLPATYIVGPDGAIRYRHIGELDWSKPEVRAQILGLLK